MKIAKNTVAGLSNKYVSLANLQLSISFVYLQALSHWGHKVILPGPFRSQISFLKTYFINSKPLYVFWLLKKEIGFIL